MGKGLVRIAISIVAAVWIGNFGDDAINAFGPTTGALVGKPIGKNGTPLASLGESLWALIFGNGSSNAPTTTLYVDC